MTIAAIRDLVALPEPDQSRQRGERRHLRALPRPRVHRAPRLVHGIVALVGLGGIIAAQLGLSLALSDGAYRLSALQGQSTALARSEQTLAERVAVLSSPQHIAVAAEEHGMLAGQPSQFLTLGGAAATAGGPDALHMQVPALDGTGMYVPNALLATEPQAAATVQAVADELASEPYPGMLLPAEETAAAGQQPGEGETEDANAPAQQNEQQHEAPTPGTLLPAAATASE